MAQEQFRFIANNIDVEKLVDKLPDSLKQSVKDMEQADRDNQYFLYAELSDQFEIDTKAYVSSRLTMHEWHLLCEKYSLPPEETH